jgi:hypothetical protein
MKNKQQQELINDLVVLLRDACALARRLEHASDTGEGIDLALSVQTHLRQVRGNLDTYMPAPSH